MTKMTIEVECKDQQQADAIQKALEDEVCKASTIVIGLLMPMKHRARCRVMRFIEDEIGDPDSDMNAKPDDHDAEADRIMDMPSIELEISVRARKCLARFDITTIGQLTRMTEKELLTQRLVGRTTVNEIKARLADYDLKLAEPDRLRPVVLQDDRNHTRYNG